MKIYGMYIDPFYNYCLPSDPYGSYVYFPKKRKRRANKQINKRKKKHKAYKA